MGKDPITLEELTGIIRRFVEERGWVPFQKPRHLAMSLAIEVGELLELFQWRNDEEIEFLLEDEQYKVRLSEEIADVMIYLLRVADTTSIDPIDAVVDKMKKNSEKYPVDEFHDRIPTRT